MGFGNIGMMEMLIGLVIVLLLFGAKRLPELGSSFGKGIRAFKSSLSEDPREPSNEGLDGPRKLS